MRNITEIPEKWTILKITHNGNTHYKVFGSWAGGYLDGDRWKLNSGISLVEEDENNYYFYGHSGSCYQCYKNLYGVATSYTLSIMDSLIEKGNMHGAQIKSMDKDTNWIELLK